MVVTFLKTRQPTTSLRRLVVVILVLNRWGRGRGRRRGRGRGRSRGRGGGGGRGAACLQRCDLGILGSELLLERRHLSLKVSHAPRHPALLLDDRRRRCHGTATRRVQRHQQRIGRGAASPVG